MRALHNKCYSYELWMRIFVRDIFINFDILKQFIVLGSMQNTIIGIEISKEKVQCTNVKF